MVEQRYAAVLEVIRDGLAVVDVAARYGVSRQTVYTWIHHYETGGLAALADRSHKPTSCPHQLGAAIEAAICDMRRRHPTWGQVRIGHELARAGISPPSLSAIYRTLARNGLLIPGARRRKKSDYQRWERNRPTELWQLDVMGGVALHDGTEAKVLTGIDDHSRYCVAAGLMASANARAVCRVFPAALVTHGVPDEILTDNGKVFTGRFSKPPVEVLFDRLCRENGITHRLTAVRSPTTTGKIERFHRTLRLEFLAGQAFADLGEAQLALDAWVADDNTRRPHQAIGMATPAERFSIRLDELDAPVLEPTPGPSPNQVTRHVTVSGNISVTGQTFNVGKRYAGRTVVVDVGRTVLHIYFDGALVRSLPRKNNKPHRPIRSPYSLSEPSWLGSVQDHPKSIRPASTASGQGALVKVLFRALISRFARPATLFGGPTGHKQATCAPASRRAKCVRSARVFVTAGVFCSRLGAHVLLGYISATYGRSEFGVSKRRGTGDRARGYALWDRRARI